LLRILNEIIIALLLFSFPVNATEWHVNNNTAGRNNGTSSTDAWESFSAINWGSIKPGDELIIHEGTYFEQLTITNLNGTESSLIIIRGDGKVIINAEKHNRDYAIFQENCSYVTVKDLILYGGKHYAYRFRYNDFCKILNVDIPKPYADGISLRNNSNSEVAYCNIQTPDFVAEQSDCIYSQENKNMVYHHNVLAVYNTYDKGHNDCLQMFKDSSTTVYNNLIIQDTDKNNNSQGIYSTTGSGIHKYYNNVINMHNTQSNALAFRKLDGTGTVELYNNIVYGKRLDRALYITGTKDPVIKNNIFVSDFKGTVATIKGWSGNPSNIDYNVFYSNSRSKIIRLNGVKLTWADWQSLGFDEHGFNENPLLQQDELIPRAEFLMGEGEKIPFFNFDFNDSIRIKDAWNIGAYE
jgi:Right handed beta helix region